MDSAQVSFLAHFLGDLSHNKKHSETKLHMSPKFKLVGEENCKYIFLLGRFALLAYTIAIIESDK